MGNFVALILITQLGNFVVWLLLAFLMEWLGRKEARTLIAALLTCFIITELVKTILKFPRPPSEQWLVQVDDPYGFPSGHAATAFLASTYLALHTRPFIKALLLIMASLVAYSRIALGVHYPVDVLGGAFLGIALAMIFEGLEGLLEAKNRYVLGLTVPLSLILYFTFPVRPGLISGLVLGYGVSMNIQQYRGRECKVKYLVVGVIVLALLLLPLYLRVGPKFIEALLSFLLISYPLVIHHKLFLKKNEGTTSC